jgi:hypothetical protein
LRKKNQVNASEHIPLTIGEARREIMELLESKSLVNTENKVKVAT